MIYAGDIGYVKRCFGYCIKSKGDEDLVFLEMFKGTTLSKCGVV